MKERAGSLRAASRPGPRPAAPSSRTFNSSARGPSGGGAGVQSSAALTALLAKGMRKVQPNSRPRCQQIWAVTAPLRASRW